MTRAFHALERSLRDGPPDESGYVAEAVDVTLAAQPERELSVLTLERVRRAQFGRRSRTRAPSLSFVTVLAIGVVVAFGGLVAIARLGQIGAGAEPTPYPSGSPSGPAVLIPPLTETFESPRNGFSVDYPSGWSVRPATKAWPQDFFLPLGNPALDELKKEGEARLNVASQPLGAGETEAEWLASYAHAYQGSKPCGTTPATSPTLAIDGHTAYLVTDGCPMSADQHFSSPDVAYGAVVVAAGRVYEITFDGNVDRAYFDAIAVTIRLNPASAVDD